jgi:ethylbenzene dioxygenase ferredoxin component
MTTERLLVCPRLALPPGSIRRVERPDGSPLAVYNVEGTYYATDDRCTHAVASLSEGDLEGDCIVCPVHFGTFHIPTGRALCFPVKRDVATYPVEVDDTDVYVVIGDQAGRSTPDSQEVA